MKEIIIILILKKKRVICVIGSIFLLLAVLCFFLKIRGPHKAGNFDFISNSNLVAGITFGDDNQNERVKIYGLSDKAAAFIPTDLYGCARVFFDGFKELRIVGNYTYKKGDQLKDLENGKVYRAELISWLGKEESSFPICFYWASDIATIYFDTRGQSTEQIDNDKTKFIRAQFKTINTDGDVIYEGVCKLKTRGQSSFLQSQKPYNFKTEEAISPFGMSSATEWALLANFRDGTHRLRDKMTFIFARQLGLEYTPESEFCNLYIDGEYRGLYLLSQRTTIDGGSVQINDMAKEHKRRGDDYANDPEVDSALNGIIGHYKRSSVSAVNITGGYLLEESFRYDLERSYFSVPTQPSIIIKNPHSVSDEEYQYISSYVNNAVNVLNNEKSSIDDIGEFFDLESWEKVYMLHYFSVEEDVEFDSFKFYKKRDDPLLYAGPVWDFELAYGHFYFEDYPLLSERTNFIIEGNVNGSRGCWLSKLENHQEFKSDLVNLYKNQFSPMVRTYMQSEFESEVSAIKNSYIMSSLRCGRDSSCYDDDVNVLRTWINNRLNFLDDYTEHQDEYKKVTFVFWMGTFSYYLKKGTAPHYVPSYEYKGERLANFKKNGKWIQSDGSEFDPDKPLTQDITVNEFLKKEYHIEE